MNKQTQFSTIDMREQEVFDTIAVGLMKQGKPSKRRGDCLYRGPDGLKCAAGILLPDEFYSEDFEHVGWIDLIVKRHVSAVHADLILAAQRIHDADYPEGWLDGSYGKFKLLAELLDLDSAALDNAYVKAKEDQCSTQ
jgi:hypothetical protein